MAGGGGHPPPPRSGAEFLKGALIAVRGWNCPSCRARLRTDKRQDSHLQVLHAHCKPKVGQFAHCLGALTAEEKVRGRHIPMHISGRMYKGQGSEGVANVLGHQVSGQAHAALYQLLQMGAKAHSSVHKHGGAAQKSGRQSACKIPHGPVLGTGETGPHTFDVQMAPVPQFRVSICRRCCPAN